MSAIEPSGSVAKNWNCKKDVVNRAICSYNAHRHRNSWALEQVFMGTVGSSPRRFRLCRQSYHFYRFTAKYGVGHSSPLSSVGVNECNFKRRKTGCLGWWIVGIIQKTILLMWRRTVVLV